MRPGTSGNNLVKGQAGRTLTLQQQLLRTPGGDREMVEILALVLQHDEDAVLTAGSMALEAGVATKTHILNLLHRLVDGKPISTEVASVKGYDWSIPFFCKIRVAGFMLLSAVGA